MTTLLRVTSVFLLTLCTNGYSQTNRTQTSLGKALAGATTAGLFRTEAVLQNPSVLGFLDKRAISIQKSNTQDEISGFGDIGKIVTEDNDNFSFIAAEAAKLANGGFAYLKTEDKQQFVGSFGKVASRSTSFGFTYSFHKFNKDVPNSEDLHGVNLGALHRLSSMLFVGVVGNNLLNENGLSTDISVGAQFTPFQSIRLLADIASDYTKSIRSNIHYHLGGEISVWKGVIFRGGYFKDDVKKTSGTGFGAGWISPKLKVEVGLLSSQSDLNEEQDEKEGTLSLGVVF